MSNWFKKHRHSSLSNQTLDCKNSVKSLKPLKMKSASKRQSQNLATLQWRPSTALLRTTRSISSPFWTRRTASLRWWSEIFQCASARKTCLTWSVSATRTRLTTSTCPWTWRPSATEGMHTSTSPTHCLSLTSSWSFRDCVGTSDLAPAILLRYVNI